MHIEEKLYYKEEQKMEANRVLIFILISTLSTLAITIAFLYNGNADWLMIGIVASVMLFADVMIFLVFKRSRLDLAVTKEGLYYKMTIFSSKTHLLDWKEVSAASIRKPPVKSFGIKYKFRYGQVYTMNLRQGLELKLKDGKKKFFSLKDPDEFKKAFRKLELQLEIG
jgi:hypothetical protein